MSKFFTLCKTNSKKHGLNDRPINFEKQAKKRGCGNSCFYLSIFVCFLIFCSAIYYIFGITSSATAGFEISDKQNVLEELKLKNEDLKKMANDLEDLQALKNRADQLGMVDVSQIEYLEWPENGFAMK